MADAKKTELASKSDQLLDALGRLKETEERKRQEPISTDDFHRLANEVDEISHEVFYVAKTQDRLGEQIPTGNDSIEDVKDGMEGPERRL